MNRTKTNPKLVQPDWRRSHKFDHRPYAYRATQDDDTVTLALHQPLYLDALATDESDEYYDLKIVGQNGYFIYAHKLILCSNSPFVGGLFDDQLPGETTTLFLPDIPMDSIQRILELAYNGETNVDKDKLGDFKLFLQQMGFVRLRFLLPKGVSSVVDEEYNTPAKRREDLSQGPAEPCCSKTLAVYQKPSVDAKPTKVSNAKDDQQSPSSEVVTTRSVGTTISPRTPTKSARFLVSMSSKEHEDFVILSSDSEVSDAEPTKTTPTKKPVLSSAHVAKPVEKAQELENRVPKCNMGTMSDYDKERFPDPPEPVSLSEEEINGMDDNDDIIEIFPGANDENSKKNPGANTKSRHSPSEKGPSNNTQLEVQGSFNNGPCPRREHLDKNTSSSTNLNDCRNQTHNTNLNRSHGSSESSQGAWRSCVRIPNSNPNSRQPSEHAGVNPAMNEREADVSGGTTPTSESQERRRGKKRKVSSPEVVSLSTPPDEGQPRKRQPKILSGALCEI